MFAAKVDGLIAAGDIAGAQAAAAKARNWAIAAAVSGPIFVVLYLLFFGGMAALGAL